MKLLKKALLVAGALSMMTVGASAANFKLATNVREDSQPGRLLQELTASISERTEGRVNIKVFASGVLGDQSQYMQQIQRGVIDMGLVNSAALETVSPAYGVVNLPYMFRTVDEYVQVMTDPGIKKAFKEAAAPHKFFPIGFLSNGFRGVYTTREVSSIEDLKGLKIRTMASPTYIEMIDRFGFVATPIAYTELFPALQQGVVDGGEGGMGGLWDNKVGEIAKWGIVTDHTRLTDFLVSSLRFEKKVSPEDYKIVVEEFDRISAKSLDVIDVQIEEFMKLAVEKNGVTYIYPDKEPLIEAVKPMYAAAAKDEVKRPLLEAIFSLQGREL